MTASWVASLAPWVAEQAVMTEESRWASMADNLAVMLRCTDLAGACSFVNRVWKEFTGLDDEAARGEGWLAALHPEDLAACREAMAKAAGEQQPFRLEYRLRRADGAWRWVVEQGHVLPRHGPPAHLLANCIDVTEMQQALAERDRMVEERDALVQELQHRVRNNAQATSSLLSLQATRSLYPVVATALRGAAARVLLATQVQDRMFRLAGSTVVDLGQEVVAAAMAACDLAGQDRARLKLMVAPGINVPVRQAAPLALIVNELTTNALHHAFPPGSGGMVRIALRRTTPGQAELEVTDDGIGLPDARPGAEGHQAGLGLHLARRLASQAGASLVVEAPSTGGTRLCLRFPAADNAAPLAGL
jgi:two-component system, sensor histidine kinase PdtaS